MGANKPNIKEMAAYICAALVVYFWLSWHVFTNAQSPKPEPNWTRPTAMTLKRVSVLESAQSSTVAFPNIRCSLNDYRYTTSKDMYSGCFSDSAYGLFDVGNQALIFNGTDEALPVLPYMSHQVLVPWPGAEFLSVDPAPYSGSYLSLYTNPQGAMSDNRNIFLKLTSKQLNSPPNLPLKDKNGQRLSVNSQTLTISDNGSWMVVESQEQSFVRMNLSTLEIKPFTNNYVFNGNVNQPSQIAISDSGQYVAIFNNPAKEFRIYDLSNCPIISKNLEPEYCPYFDYLDFVKKQISGAISIKNIAFINENLLSFEIISSKSEESGIYELAPTDGIDNLMEYLGLGDSYTSGEGAFDYRPGTDSTDNMCHLSANSYPMLISRDLYNTRSGNSVACSGAVLQDVGSSDDKYKGQVKNVLDFTHLKAEQPLLLSSVMTNYMPGYVAQQRFIGHYSPKIVTVSIGGNDVGFGDLLESCVMAKATRHRSDNDCFSTYEDRQEVISLIDRNVASWTKLFRDLKKKSPNSTLVAIGYPQVADDQGSCGLNVNLSRIELELSIEVVKYINSSIQKSAASAGISYVDIGDALEGHKLCQAKSYNIAVNGLTAGKDGGVFGINVLGKESYHPNALGHQLIEQSILRKTKNFSIYASQVAAPDSTKMLNSPKSGRQTYSRVPSTVTTKVAKRGGTIKLSVKSKQSGIKPSTTYKVTIGQLTNSPLASVSSNSEGDIDANINIPVDQEPGGQDIHIIGEGNSGQQIDLTQPIYLPVSDADSDGDGIDDIQDSCPNMYNSGQDEDKDSIDDVCDPLIGNTSTNQGSGSGNTNTTNSQITGSASTNGSNYVSVSGQNQTNIDKSYAETSTVSSKTNKQSEPKTNDLLNSPASTKADTPKTNKRRTFNEILAKPTNVSSRSFGVNLGLFKFSLNFWLIFTLVAWIFVFIFLYYREEREQNTKYQLAR